MSYKLYHIDSRGEKRYLQVVAGTKDWATDSEEVALKRRWAEAQQGVVLQIESDDEQGDRIRENWREAQDEPMSLARFEAIFEDRDPFEFL
jgi:TusA-related sulfurtransferase